MKKFIGILIFAAAVWLGGVTTALAQVVIINEIVYDLPGTDTDREWIEVFNTGSSAVDLTGWKFFEANVNHGLTVIQGDISLSAGGFAVIVDNPNKFFEDWPGFAGTIFDSSFSLSNTGEPLALKDNTGVVVNEVTYSSAWGAAGDGNSLQKTVDGWIAALPTPGAVNAAVSAPPPPAGGGDAGGGDAGDNLGDESDISAHAQPTELSPVAAQPKKPLTIDPGRKRLVVVGAPVYLRAKVSNAAKESGVRIYWSLGDGNSAFGPETIHQYYFPGTYIVVVNAFQAGEEAVGRTAVEVVEPQAAIEEVGFSPRPYVKVVNRSARELNLGYWQIRSGEKTLTLPADTLIAGNGNIYLPLEQTKLSLSDAASLDLLYPSGRLADSKKLLAEGVTVAGAPELSEEAEALAEQIARLNGEIKVAIERIKTLPAVAVNRSAPRLPVTASSQPPAAPVTLQTQTAAVAAVSQLPPPPPAVIEISRPAGPVKRGWSFIKGWFGAADKQ